MTSISTSELAKCGAGIWFVGGAKTTQPMTTTTQRETKAETNSEDPKWKI